MGKTETERLYYNFWKQLLEKSNEKMPLFSGIKKIRSYAKQSFLSKGAGVDGAKYQYVILVKSPMARVQLTFESGQESKNKKMYNKLWGNRLKIESELGKDYATNLEWLPLDNCISSRISKIVIDKGLNDEDKWDMIQNKMVEDMFKLWKATRDLVIDSS